MALGAQTTADITIRQQFSAVSGLLGGLYLCCYRGVHVVLFGFGGSFRWCGTFFWWGGAGADLDRVTQVPEPGEIP